ncbi:MAG: Ig-like domain-containing protein [Dysgonamonadaceae bacterium]
MISGFFNFLNNIKFRYISFLLIALFIVSCANRGTPSGGDYDLDPPKLVSITPAIGATNVKNLKTITILFDENVQLEKPGEKVIITPPQHKAPVFTVINRKIKIALNDTLIPNTTYVFDFTDALADNNEKNVLDNFVVTFSTGDKVDSLQVSGKVLAANNLEPVTGIFVGLHSNLEDSAFVKTPFERISKTNSKGEFTIRGVTPEKYRLYALNDANNNYKYDNPSEAIAFLDSLVIPSSERASRTDTIFKADKKTVDTLEEKQFTRFLPDNIILRSFNSAFGKQFLQKYERPTNNTVTLLFANPTTRPKMEFLDEKKNPDFPTIEERSYHNDSIKYWITDPEIIKNDSLRARVTYIKTDSLNIGREVSDTLKLFFREFKGKKKDNKDKKGEEEIKFINIKQNLGSTVDITQNLYFEFEEPIKDFDKNKLILSHMKDSVYTPVEYTLFADTLNPRFYRISNKWIPGDQYKISADSAAFHGYSGLWTNKLEGKFSIKKEEEYGLLFLNLINLPDNMPAFAELLDKSDKPIRKVSVKDKGILFRYINPGTYYVRLILDKNGNGQWDTGDFFKDLQPEMVYYNPKAYEIKANWDSQDDWDLNKVPVDKQKPLEITKNRPQERKTKRQQLEEAEAKKNSKSSNTTTGKTGTSTTTFTNY